MKSSVVVFMFFFLCHTLTSPSRSLFIHCWFFGLGRVLVASWSHLGRVLVASWSRLGRVFVASWSRLDLVLVTFSACSRPGLFCASRRLHLIFCDLIFCVQFKFFISCCSFLSVIVCISSPSSTANGEAKAITCRRSE